MKAILILGNKAIYKIFFFASLSQSFSCSSNILKFACLTNEDAEKLTLARYFKGDDAKAFNLDVNVEDHLFVDLIVLAKNYSLVYKQSKSFAPGFEAEISAANVKLGGKLNLTKKTDYSFEVNLTDNKNYLIGFKTIDWDDLDWD